MPGQFFSPEGDLEEYFITNHWLIDQYIGNQLWGWSQNTNGSLGTNDVIHKTTPVQEFTSSTNWALVASGENDSFFPHSAAIKSDGTLWCWGGNSAGQLGVNDNRSRSTPVQEWTSSNNWKQVAVSLGVTAAIKTDGTLWVWGGYIGFTDGIRQRSTPTQDFTSQTNWKQIVIRRGNNSDFNAIKTDGTLWAWGSNDFGLIPDPTISTGSARSTPVQEISSSTNWKFLLSGNDAIHSMAVKTDGSLWGWGTNAQDQLGLRSSVSQFRSPVRVLFTQNDFIKQGHCSERGTHVIKSDGTLWSWGDNNINRIFGNDDLSFQSSPVQEASYSTNWKYVNGVTSTIFAIKTDGTLWGWGNNRNTSSRSIFPSTTAAVLVDISTPVQESTGRTNWKQVSGCLGVLTGIEMDTGNLT